MIKYIYILLFFVLSEAKAQVTVFVEPYVAFKYDTSEFVPVTNFSNSIYGTEAHSFYSLIETDTISDLFISSVKLIFQPTNEMIDEEIDKEIFALSELENEKSDIIDIEKFQINDFKGIAMIVVDKSDQQNRIIQYSLNKYTKSVVASILFSEQTSSLSIKDHLDKNIRIELLTESIVIYEKTKLDEISEKIISKYNVKVQNLPHNNIYDYKEVIDGKAIYKTTTRPDTIIVETRIREFPKPHTFRGELIVEPPIQLETIEIKILNNFGSQIFDLEKSGELIFTSTDEANGIVEKTGVLVVKSEIGNKVSIPFSFNYENKK